MTLVECGLVMGHDVAFLLHVLSGSRGLTVKGRGFESRPVRFQVTALGKLLTRMCLCDHAV